MKTKPMLLHANKPLVSFVIPAYNEEGYIGACLKSLSYQKTNVAYEVIVVDNNSSDKTSEVAESYGARVVFQPIQGVCAARQAGTEAARGKIIISTDADATFHPDYLEKIMKQFKKHPEAVAIAGTPYYVDPPLWGAAYEPLIFSYAWLIYKLTGNAGYVSACNTAFKKSAWEGYNISMTQGGDEFGLLKQLKKHGKVVVDLHNPVNTSSRRLQRGFLYNFFVTLMTYYIGDYILAKITGHSVLGSYPAFRTQTDRIIQKRNIQIGTLMVASLISFYVFWRHDRQVVAGLESRIHSLENHLHNLREKAK